MPGANPRIVQLREAPTVVPCIGTAHVPWLTSVADPQDMGDCAKRTAYDAAEPAPSETSVNATVSDVSVTSRNARSVTVPGFVTTGLVTVRPAVPCAPSLVAVIVAFPAATPLTSPLADTVAAAVLLDAHVTERPDRSAPLLSFGVAVSCCVAPTAMLAVAGVTVTDLTGVGFAAVVPLATLDRFPKVASTFNVPR